MGGRVGMASGLATLVILVLGGLMCITLSFEDRLEPLNLPRTTNFSRPVAEDIRLSRHGCYGIDLVRCGSCRIEKRKIGALTVGGFNVLLLKELDLVVPPDERDGGESDVHAPDAMELARRLGVMGGGLNLGRRPLRFSGLHVENLRLATLDSQTNVCPCLVAKSGDAERDGLHLRGCMIVRGGTTNAVGRAVLRVKPDLRLTWADGELKI